MTPLKAVRLKCLDCCCGSADEVRLCPCEDCPLHQFRFGKNPNIKLSAEEKARRASLLPVNAQKYGTFTEETLSGG